MLGFLECFWPLTRVGMGVHALSLAGPVTLLIMFVYTGVADCPQMVPYMGLWLVGAAFQRLRADRNQHSKYTGWPGLTALAFPSNSEGLLKALEALLVAAAGGVLFRYAPALGLFVGAGGVTLFASEFVERVLARSRTRRMHDARVVQRQMIDDYRRGNW